MFSLTFSEKANSTKDLITEGLIHEARTSRIKILLVIISIINSLSSFTYASSDIFVQQEMCLCATLRHSTFKTFAYELFSNIL